MCRCEEWNVGKLVLHLPDGTTRDIPLSKERVTIGRRADNDVALPFPAVSAEHAAVVTILDDSFLEDLGSTNGTFVNDKAIAKHFLRDRDRLDVGREILVYYADDAAIPELLPPELMHHDRGNIIEPLSAQISALSDRTRHRASRVGESRLVVAEFDPASTGPMTGQIATEFDALAEADDATERTRPVRAQTPVAEHAAAGALPIPEIERTVDTLAPTFIVRVVTGPNAGREISVADAEVRLGRVGVQVATLRREGDRVRLVPLEGDDPPKRNGEPVSADGAMLQPGDMFDVAGTTLSLVRA